MSRAISIRKQPESEIRRVGIREVALPKWRVANRHQPVAFTDTANRSKEPAPRVRQAA